MSKPGLGRGLTGLLAAPLLRSRVPPGADAAGRNTGVQLLLRGENGQPIVPPSSPALTAHAQEGHTLLPQWALGCLLVADVLLVLTGAWIILASRAPGSRIIGSLVLLLGGALLSLGASLRGEPVAEELPAQIPPHEPEPRIRIRFLEENR